MQSFTSASTTKVPIGKYLVEQLVEWNLKNAEGPFEHRSLGDTPALGVILNPNGGVSEWIAGTGVQLADELRAYGQEPADQGLHTIDIRYIQEDFFAKVARFARDVQPLAKFDE